MKFVLPDLVLLLLMLIPFNLIFWWKGNNQRMSKIPEIKASESIKIYYRQSEAWIDKNQDLLKQAKKRKSYALSNFKNVPTQRTKKPKVSAIRNKSDSKKVFNLNSCSPLQSKDHIVVVVSSLFTDPTIRYIVNSKVSWIFFLSKAFTFIENIWINNQQRRNMVAYYNEENKKVNLISLKTRKVLIKPCFHSSVTATSSVKDICSVVDLVIQPALRNLPILFALKREKSNAYAADHTSKNTSLFGRAGFMGYYSEGGKLFRSNHQNYRVSKKDYFRKDRSYEADIKSIYYSNYVATKFCFFDSKHINDRPYVNDCKYQTIIVSEIIPQKPRIIDLANLERITGGIFSSCKLDFFFFVDKKTLGLVVGDKVCFVDFLKVEITRCVELRGLYAPLLRAGFDKNRIFVSYWYDRVRKRVFFSIGVQVGLMTDPRLFLTDIDLISVNYLLSGAFYDHVFYGKSRNMDKVMPNESGRVEINQNIEQDRLLQMKRTDVESRDRIPQLGKKKPGQYELSKMDQFDELEVSDEEEKVSSFEELSSEFQMEGKDQTKKFDKLTNNDNLL